MVQIADKIEDKIFWSNMKNCSELPILCRNMFNEAIWIKRLNNNFNKHLTKQGWKSSLPQHWEFLTKYLILCVYDMLIEKSWFK